ncbi:MAG: glycosyltransferase family 2 protein [Chitinivibrionia bacterium]|nr:glycosyltransferase family 2 protein [Chitinivibrionia bacterium]
MDFKNISVIVTCMNEEHTLARCLASCAGAGETLVVDSFSTDRTLEVARSHPAVVFQRPYESAAKQKNWAVDRAAREWVLILDADEELSPELRREIEALEAPRGVDGFWIRRRSTYLGRRISHCGWQRDKVLRLFRRGAGRYEEKEVHEEISLSGTPAHLAGFLIHAPYRDRAHYMRKLEEYSTRGAREYRKRGGRFPAVNMALHPPFRFLRMYVFQGGFLDGSRGFELCALSAYGVWRKYSKARSMKRCGENG